jgi:AAA+ superfamily predicted ATPase
MIEQLIELTKSNQFFQGTFFVGLIAAVGYTLKNWVLWLYGRIVRYFTYVVVVEEKSQLYVILNEYLYQRHNNCFKNVEADMEMLKGKEYKLGISEDRQDVARIYKKQFEDNTKFAHKNARTLSLKQNIDSFALWINKRPVFFNKRKDELKGANDIYSATKGAFEIRTIFGKKIIHDWLNKIIEEYNNSLTANKEIKVYISGHNNYNGWQIHKTFTPISLERVICEPKVKEDLIADIVDWSNKKEHYTNLGLTHKRGYLLYGEPGNGKSSLVMAIAREFERDIYYLDINSFTSEENMRRAFSEIGAGCILLIEDIDTVWGRINDEGQWDARLPANKDCKVTFSFFLNLLNGVLDKEDLLLFMTTNNLSKLDEALIRPGRIDYRVEITKPNRALVEKYLCNYYEKNLSLLTYGKSYSYAELLNICKKHEDYNDTIKELC